MNRPTLVLIILTILMFIFSPSITSAFGVGYGISMIQSCFVIALVSLCLSYPLRLFTSKQSLVLYTLCLYIILLDVLVLGSLKPHSLYSLLSFSATLFIATQIPILPFKDFKNSFAFLHKKRSLLIISSSTALITLLTSLTAYSFKNQSFLFFSEPSHFYILMAPLISYTMLTANLVQFFLLLVLYLISFILTPSLILIFILFVSCLFRLLTYRTSSIFIIKLRNLFVYPALFLFSITSTTNIYITSRLFNYSENISTLVLIRSYQSFLFSLTNPYFGDSFGSGLLPQHFTSFWSQTALELQSSGWVSTVDLSSLPGQLSLVFGSFGSLIAILIFLLLGNFLFQISRYGFSNTDYFTKICYFAFLVSLSIGALCSFVRFVGISSPSFIYVLICVFRPSKYFLFDTKLES